MGADVAQSSDAAQSSLGVVARVDADVQSSGAAQSSLGVVARVDADAQSSDAAQSLLGVVAWVDEDALDPAPSSGVVAQRGRPARRPVVAGSILRATRHSTYIQSARPRLRISDSCDLYFDGVTYSVYFSVL